MQPQQPIPPQNTQSQQPVAANQTQQYAAPQQPAMMVATPIRYIMGNTILGKTGVAQMTFDGQNISIQDQSGQMVATWPIQNTVGYSDNKFLGASIKYDNQKIILNAVTWSPLLYALPNVVVAILVIVSLNVSNPFVGLFMSLMVIGYALGMYFYQRDRIKASGLSNLLQSLSAYGIEKKVFLK